MDKYWCDVMFSIGHYAVKIENMKGKDMNDDDISKLFCGYWILMSLNDD